jgi:GT2 family glycosyltransferase
MKLSVIIVNYNVKYFLEQCLHSTLKAMEAIDGEIWVVDNNSVDGSVEMVQQKFPTVKIIANTDNKGFSKANNQAIVLSTGEYVLLLNPDTVVEEDTFSKVLSFMDSHSDAGGLGVKMIDGSGNFLPESKRGLPTYDVAFYKIFGLSAFFPKSKIFGKYHLGFLDPEEIHPVEILAGAFMLLRRSVLDKVGLLDEDFFMYGEDIDLSYRIIKAGYKNYYFPETRIIHYKGESTKRSSVNYVFVFYNAMIIFAQKHFSKSNASLFTFFIRLAIYLRAFAALLMRFIKTLLLPALDFILLFVGMYLMKNYWSSNFNIRYPDTFLILMVPVYCFVWIISIFFSGGYDYPIKPARIVRGIFTGTILILIIYALLPEAYRFSRALILLGAFWASAVTITARLVISLFTNRFKIGEASRKRLLIVGNEEEGNRILSLLKLSETTHNFIGFVTPESDVQEIKSSSDFSKYFLGKAGRLKELAEVYAIDEIIFCGKDISSQEIINFMSLTVGLNVEYKIAPPESMFIIGSSSVENPGELYIIDINSISNKINKRNKRFMDFLLSLAMLLLLPVFILTQKNAIEFIRNLFRVLTGKISWVGYSGKTSKLPYIKKGVLNPLDGLTGEIRDDLTINRLNSLYAKDYRVYTDLNIVRKGWRKLGRSPF